MILFLIRMAATGVFLYMLWLAGGQQNEYPAAGDLTPAYLMAGTVLAAFFAALTWAPVFGEAVSGPLTAVYSEGSAMADPFLTIRLMRWAHHRGWRRLAVALSFWEGLNRPWLPTPFIMGMRNARRGGLLEKWFAREVYRFNNMEHCLDAYEVCARHGIALKAHAKPEVNRMIISKRREARPVPRTLEAPRSEAPVSPAKNRNIQLFRRNDAEGASDAVEG